MCRHERIVRSYSRTSETRHLIEQRLCWKCGITLPLGPSNDEPDAVQIEMRSAEIAATAYERRGRSHVWRSSLMSNCELDGVFMYGDDREPTCPAEESGYLAACIVEGEP